ncbi:MmgE/PrpD family protein [Antarctobacter sp.]|uniref:MmgE/PrpD family protein n=1 Tax=Antarctobacter sp. TaxID=1872577 RepID=UPI003A90215C
MTNPRPITAELARYAVQADYDALPGEVQVEAMRAFLNWIGCALGGSREDVALHAAQAVACTGGPAQATRIGHGMRTDMASAAFLNSVASNALAYDDTHLATVTHPSGPVAAPLFAHAETEPVSGKAFLAALALGIEVQCRLSNVLLLPPAEGNVALYITGQTGPIGGAVALGKVMGFDETRMGWAIGYGATQGAGIRATHGAMSALVVPGIASRAAMFAAHLAKAGLECMGDTLESPKGFFAVHARGASHDRAVERLGTYHEMLANTYKPYPAGIVVQPAIDACRDILEQAGGTEVVSLTLRVHPLTMTLADRRHPKDMFEAQVSLYHWAAAVILRGEWGVDVTRQAMISDAEIARFRERVVGVADPSLGRDQARAEAVLADGRRLTACVEAARGSMARKMTDAELDAKFLGQARTVLKGDRPEHLLALLRDLASVPDVAAAVAPALAPS